jgi:hypothetical protein
LLVLVGNIAGLVEGASLIFLLVFALVNWLAYRQGVGARWIALCGLGGSLAGAVMLALHLAGIA